MKDPNLFKEIEMVIYVTLLASVKISVESVAESVISKYSMHNSKIRPVGDKTANDEILLQSMGLNLERLMKPW